MKKLVKIFAVFFLAFIVACSPLATTKAVHADDSSSQLTLPITYYATSPLDRAQSIVKSTDGNIWFTMDRTGSRGYDINHNVINPVTGSIGRITPDGVITEFLIPTIVYKYINNAVDSNSFNLTAGPDGNIWFTEAEASKVGKITPEGIITEYSLPTNIYPQSITSSSDATIWFMTSSDQTGSTLINMNTNGTILKELPIHSNVYGHSLIIGPDGNFWFRGVSNFAIAKMTPDGTYTEYPTSGIPVDILAGNNNDIWFGQNGGLLGHSTTNGIITYSDNPPGGLVWDLTKDTANNIWIKDACAENIVMLSSDGQTRTTYSLNPQSGDQTCILAEDIVFGSDGNIWFVGDGEVGEIELTSLTSTPTVSPTPTSTETPTPTVTLTATPTPTTEEPTPTATDVPTVTATPEPTATPTDTPTPTELLTPTNTPVPTDTPEPSPTCTPTPTQAPNSDTDANQKQTVQAVVTNSQSDNSSNNSSPENDGLLNMQIFTSNTGNTSDGNLFIESHPGSMKLHVKIDLANPFTMTTSTTQVLLPWQQGYNTVGDIFNFTATSVFNGYPVTTLDHPAIITLHYDPARLFGHSLSELRIGWFNDQTKKWEVLNKNTTVIDQNQHLIANTTTHMGYYTFCIQKPKLSSQLLPL